MKQLSFLVLVALCLVSGHMVGQNSIDANIRPTNIPPLNDNYSRVNLPDWAKLMYSDSPNVSEVDRLYQEFYEKHTFVKNEHTRNYKHWRKLLHEKGWVLPNGDINIATKAEMQNADIAFARLRNNESSGQRSTTNTWTNIGPTEVKNNTGNTKSIQSCQISMTQCIANKNVLYSITQNGKVFKTIDHGSNWFPVSDNYNIGSDTWSSEVIAVDPNNENTVYVAAGTWNSAHYLFKSTDGGTTWATIQTFPAFFDAYSIIISPNNAQDIIISSSKGIYKSTDGMATYTITSTQKAYDLKYKTNDPTVVFGLFSDAVNKKSVFKRSTDGGTTWTQIDNGWFSAPQIHDGGSRMSVSTGNPNLIYCIVMGKVNENHQGIMGVARSADGGDTWTTPIDHTNAVAKGLSGGQGFYDLDIEVTDDNDNNVLIGISGWWRSTDGCNTLSNVGGAYNMHEDAQEFQFNGPNDNWVCHDGGIDLFASDLSSRAFKSKGLVGTEFWGYAQGWNEDTRFGSLYHNGVLGAIETYPNSAGNYVFTNFQTGEPSSSYAFLNNPRSGAANSVGEIVLGSVPGTVTSKSLYASFPNEAAYDMNARSEIVQHPNNYNIHFQGKANVLLKSDNGGKLYNTLYHFSSSSSNITGIEICHTNPAIMYVVQRGNGTVPCTLWKTTNGGNTFTAINHPIPSNLSDALIAIDPLNPNRIWMAFVNGGVTQNKIYKSDNSGTSWTNLTTSLLNNTQIRGIIHAGGTDGDVYLMLNHAVLFRNNSSTNWMNYSDGLPVTFGGNYFVPFYKKKELRMATIHRGLWSVPMMNSFTPIANPTANVDTITCHQDTVKFEDYSILDHDGATWSWSFNPAPSYISNPNTRNPKALFNTPGPVDVTLTLTSSGGSNSRTVTNMLYVLPNQDCTTIRDTIPNKALELTQNGQQILLNKPINIGASTRNFTLMAWIRPSVSQTGVRGIICDATTVTELHLSDNELRIHYNGNWWNIASGLFVPVGEWSHVAMTSSSSGIKVYLNGVEATIISSSPPLLNFTNSVWRIGNDRGDSGRSFVGKMDEVCIYNRTLLISEIREKMHLVKNPMTDPSLLGYFQFAGSGINGFYNQGNSGYNFGYNEGLTVKSTAPVGTGSASRKPAPTLGQTLDFINEGVSLTFPSVGTLPTTELTVTRLNTKPDTMPVGLGQAEKYWIINDYNSNTFSPLAKIALTGYGPIEPWEVADSSGFKLYKRRTGQDFLPTWLSPIDSASVVTYGPNGALTFNYPDITSFSQFTIVKKSTKTTCHLVTSNSEAGPNSLRAIIDCVADGDTVLFAPSLANATIDLSTYKEICIEKNVKIIADPALNITISASQSGTLAPTLFHIKPTYNVEITGLNLIGGTNQMGNTIINEGNLSLKNVTVNGSGVSNIQSVVLNKDAGQIVVIENCTVK